MLRPWLIGIGILICATIVIAFCYADDIRQSQKDRLAMQQKAPRGRGRKTGGLIPAVNPLGQLAAFVPPWRSQQNPDAMTWATPTPMSFNKSISIVSPSVVGVNTTGAQEQGASGIIVHRRGYVLTNYHVIKGAKDIVVTLVHDQVVKTYSAEVVEVRPEMDLAMIRLRNTGSKQFTPAPLGDSNRILIGQQVIAIGNPFGLSQSASAGIISNTDRTLTAGEKVFDGLIQTDASINPGSSGGALVNTNAEVIGINTAIYSPTMGFSGIGFAVPINQAKRVFAPCIQIVESPLANKANTQPVKANSNNRVYVPAGGTNLKMVAGANQKAQRKPCWLGVDIYPASSVMAREFDVPFHGGVLVNRVFAYSPAGLAGMQRDDVLFRIDGRRVKNQDMLWSYLATKKSGERIKVTLFRNGMKKTVIVVLEPEPANVHSLLSKSPTGRPIGRAMGIEEISWIGVDIQPLGAAWEFGVKPNQDGVFVGEVEGIAAINAGLQPGDIIKKVNNMRVKDIEAFKKIIINVDPSKGVVLDVMRQNRLFYITVHSANRDLGAWQ